MPRAKYAFRRRAHRLIVWVALGILGALAWGLWPEGSAPPTTESMQSGPWPSASAEPEKPTPALAGDSPTSPQPPPDAERDGGDPSRAKEPPKWQTYPVRSGDTLGAIAARFGLQLWTLEAANGLRRDEVLRIGQELTIPAVDGVLHRVQAGDTMWDIAAWHSVDVDTVIEANADIEPGALPLGYLVLVPGGRPPARSAPLAARGGTGGGSVRSPAGPASAEATPATPAGGDGGRLEWPLRGQITDGFGWRIHPVYQTPAFHEGVDIAADAGTPIRAAAAGTVTRASAYGGWGLTVELNHGDGLVTRYSHASRLLVKVGDRVQAGQEIALVGSTGVSTGPHLDFGVYVNGSPGNPMDRLP